MEDQNEPNLIMDEMSEELAGKGKAIAAKGPATFASLPDTILVGLSYPYSSYVKTNL